MGVGFEKTYHRIGAKGGIVWGLYVPFIYLGTYDRIG